VLEWFLDRLLDRLSRRSRHNPIDRLIDRLIERHRDGLIERWAARAPCPGSGNQFGSLRFQLAIACLKRRGEPTWPYYPDY
jgi:hypothetical protein